MVEPKSKSRALKALDSLFKLTTSNFSFLILLLVAITHLFYFFLVLRNGVTLVDFDPYTMRFRPSEFFENYRKARNTFDFKDAFVVTFPAGTVFLSVLAAISVIRVEKPRFWRYCGLAGIIAAFGALGILIAPIIVKSVSIFPISLYIILEAIGWFLTLTGLIFERVTNSKIRGPIVAREVGVFAVAASVWLNFFQDYHALSKQFYYFLLAVLIIAYIVHFFRTYQLLMMKDSLDSVVLGKFILAHGWNLLIFMVPTTISLFAIYLTTQQNTITNEVAFSHIEVTGQKTSKFVTASNFGPMLLCRLEVFISNVGGAGTSITELDLEVQSDEVNYSPAPTDLKILSDEFDDIFPYSKYDEVELVKRASSIFGYSGFTLRVVRPNSDPPQLISISSYKKGLMTAHFWGENAPKTEQLLAPYFQLQETEIENILQGYEDGSGLTSLIEANFHGKFADFENTGLPIFIPSNSSKAFYVDMLVFPMFFRNFQESIKSIEAKKEKDSELPPSSVDGVNAAWVYGHPFENVRSGSLRVGVDSLAHFTNHERVLTSEGRGDQASSSCLFDEVDFSSP